MAFLFKELNASCTEFFWENKKTGILVPDASLVEQQYQKACLQPHPPPFPYWAKIWPSARALSDFINSHSSYIEGKHVTEMGCGLGLPSLTATRWATSVYATDFLPEPLEFVKQSSSHQHLAHLTCGLFNWETATEYPPTDVLLLSDVNYDPGQFPALLSLIEQYLQAHTTIILATPQRLLAKPFVDQLLPRCIQQEEYVIDLVLISVFVLN